MYFRTPLPTHTQMTKDQFSPVSMCSETYLNLRLKTNGDINVQNRHTFARSNLAKIDLSIINRALLILKTYLYKANLFINELL